MPAGPTTVLPPGPWGMFTAVWRGDRTRASARNTALRDADLLRRNLIDVRDAMRMLTEAVGDYERQMLGYGFAAVDQSLRNARFAAWATASSDG